ncbi:hypothetical protein [Dictyobacter formicarum]|uniref:Uncharacterized protein n=1 Tax=Dictyobacter formicarum TaxID=2778368 RepID=A0ABQ3VL75_9CHLR|nr:hypothetical protein [Dictyobacter formicarum]GHO86141.1 hypothetical protein KSZ_41470 [Dictyobacter formicarum]
MSKQVFALDAAATHRITVHWITEAEPATVQINGTILGTLSTVEEKAAGKDFILPDNSPLHVQFFNGYPQAFRAGFPLAAIPDVDDVPINQRQRGGCLTAWLIFNLVTAAVVAGINFLATFGALVNNRVGISPLVFLVLGLLGIVAIVGFSLLLAWKKLGFYLVVGHILVAIVINAMILTFDVKTFAPLVGIGILYAWLHKGGIWKQLD